MNSISSIEDWESLVSAIESCTLPKEGWTHQAHLVVGLWFVLNHNPAEALDLLRRKIRRYNEATGRSNSDSSGYHETLTRLYVVGIHEFVSKHSHKGLALLNVLLESPLSAKDWPFTYYSREVLMSVEARHQWVEPDLTPLASDCLK